MQEEEEEEGGKKEIYAYTNPVGLKKGRQSGAQASAERNEEDELIMLMIRSKSRKGWISLRS